MARRKLTLALGPIVAAVGRAPAGDDLTVRILDAAADHLRRHGLGRWSMDDVADAAGVGRTTVYRWFGSRDELIHQVLARELRATIAAASQAAEGAATFEDRIVESAVVCLEALDGSVVDHLLRTDPVAVLPLLTTEAAPLLALARSALAPQVLAAGLAETPAEAELAAEAIARLGLSFVLTRSSVITADRDALRSAARALLGTAAASR